LTIETPSSSWCVDRVEEVLQIESVVSHGTQTQLSSTPYLGVTDPLGTTSVSKLLSIQAVGVDALGPHIALQRSIREPRRLVKERRAPKRFGSHLAM